MDLKSTKEHAIYTHVRAFMVCPLHLSTGKVITVVTYTGTGNTHHVTFNMK